MLPRPNQIRASKPFFENSPKSSPTSYLKGYPQNELWTTILSFFRVLHPPQPPYRLSPAELEILREKIRELLEAGHIRPSVSLYGAPVLFVKKKDGTFCMCIDYRALNKQMVRNTAPIPCMDELFDLVQGAKCFSKIDLNSAYHQVRIAPEDIPKTAFNTQLGYFEFLVLTFGFTNAPTTFQTLMTQVLSPFIGRSVLVYLDDILIFSPDPESHAQHLEEVLTVLEHHQLYAKCSKCEFFKDSVEYLGHILSAEGIGTDPKKIKAVEDWPPPKNIHDLRAFLGLSNYYRRFVFRYSHVALPLTNLLRKDTSFLWGPREQVSFDTLKHCLTNPPILRIADPSRPFRVEADGSDFAIGAVLLQMHEGRWLPVAYESRKLDSAECNYPIHEKELLGLVHALRIWRHYLLGSSFDAYTDHATLTSLLTQPRLTGRRARWAETLADFHVTIKYRPGTQNIVADALSRRLDLQNPRLASLERITQYNDLLERVAKAT